LCATRPHNAHSRNTHFAAAHAVRRH
jgi:hypothetical protein